MGWPQAGPARALYPTLVLFLHLRVSGAQYRRCVRRQRPETALAQVSASKGRPKEGRPRHPRRFPASHLHSTPTPVPWPSRQSPSRFLADP